MSRQANHQIRMSNKGHGYYRASNQARTEHDKHVQFLGKKKRLKRLGGADKVVEEQNEQRARVEDVLSERTLFPEKTRSIGVTTSWYERLLFSCLPAVMDT